MKVEDINVERLILEIDELGLISEHPYPAVTRILFSEADLKARSWFKNRCEAAGLIVREDAIGNIFARWLGADQSLAPVATGSHTDAIPNAGKYDGVVGVLGGLEAIRSLQAAGFVPRRTVELIMFTAEEPTRFGVGCLGSRLMAGALTSEDATALIDRDGDGFEVWRQCGGCVGEIGSVLLEFGVYDAFVELHIEQGPLLERENLEIGVVEKIAAPAAFRVFISGQGGHAGAVLMSDRKDALLAGAELALAVEAAALASGSPDTVATTGVFEVKPGAINSIPFEVKMEIDLRDTDMEARNRAEAAMHEAIRQISARRQVEFLLEIINSDDAAICDPRLVSLAESSARKLGLKSQRMISRAYHDSLFMARVAPVTMIFIPCYKGYSHRPDEFSSPEAIRNGVAVLAETLRELSA